MFTALRKIKKKEGKETTELEKQIAQAIFDLEVNNPEFKKALQILNFTSAKEINVTKTKKAIVIFVPVKQVQQFRAIQVRLVRELEKKFSERHILVVGQRKSKPRADRTRPVSKTWEHVKNSLLDDVVYPVQITGKRTRVQADGSHFHRVYLDNKESSTYEHKISTFAKTYKCLTGERVIFEFKN